MSENEKAKVDVENLESKQRLILLNKLNKLNIAKNVEKAISSEEKFNKLKDLYTKLKDQHVALLRQVYQLAKNN